MGISINNAYKLKLFNTTKEDFESFIWYSIDKIAPNENITSDDLVYSEFEGSRSVVCFIKNRYCAKVTKDFSDEIEALKLLNNTNFAPKLYCYDAESWFIFMEYIDGYILNEYIDKFNKMPENYLREYYNILFELLDHELIEADLKIDSFIWQKKDKKLRKIDYGLCQKFPSDTINWHRKIYEEKINALLNNDQSAWDELTQSLKSDGISIDYINQLKGQ